MECFKSYSDFDAAFGGHEDGEDETEQKETAQENETELANTEVIDTTEEEPHQGKNLEKFMESLKTKSGKLAAKFLYDLFAGELDVALNTTIQGKSVKDVTWLNDPCNLSSVRFNSVQ